MALVLALLAPSFISALPSQVRGRLPDEVLRAITTPLPTALPLPINAAAASPISVADLLPSATAVPPTETSTPAPTFTAESTPLPSATAAVAAAQVTDEPVPTSTSTPSPTATPAPTATATPQPLPEAVRITGLTITPQKFNNCGSANMSVLLGYYGLADTQLDISAVVKPHYDDRNVTPEELVAYVNERTGLQAAVFRGGDIELLRRLLQAGFPVIIEKGYEPDAWQGWMGHYLTLIGYDNAAQAFTSLDTYLGPWDSSGRPISYEELEQRWAQFNHTFLVVFRSFEAEEIAELVGPAFTNEDQMWQHVAAASETAAAAEPENAFAWFNLGASLTALAELHEDTALYEAAAAAFDQSRIAGLPPRMLWYQFEPYKAYIYSGRIDEALSLAAAVMESEGGMHIEESHYYQGLAYQAAGNKDLARAAYNRALEMKPLYPAALERLDQLANVVDYALD